MEIWKTVILAYVGNVLSPELIKSNNISLIFGKEEEGSEGGEGGGVGLLRSFRIRPLGL